MVDLGEFDARRNVRLGAEEDEAVFAKHRAKIKALDLEPLMQDMDRKLFGWFCNRVDAKHAFRRAWGLTKDLRGPTIES